MLDTAPHGGLDPMLVCVRMCVLQIVYTYEYQGNAPKLVHTPLTDKCYLTLTQGMAMGCGGELHTRLHC